MNDSNIHARYVVASDDQRFLMATRRDVTEGRLVLVQNCFEELKERMGGN